MANVKVFKALCGDKGWQNILHHIESTGIPTSNNPEKVDISIILSGIHENTSAFYGKKVLAYDACEWLRGFRIPDGFNFYKPILDEYYDDFIDLTGLTIEKRAEKIKKYIGGLG